MIRIASLCLFTYWLAIFLGTHLPASSLPTLNWSDKVYHMLAFTGLSALLAWALPARPGKRLAHIWLAAAIALGYGCFDELTQQFIPGRSCDIWDVAADSIGVVIGLTIYLVARQVMSQYRWGRQLIQGLSR